MADTAVAITAGTGTNIDTRTEATNGNHRQVVVIGDPTLNAGVATVKDASTGAAAATDLALVVSIRDANVNGSATSANSAPVVIASNQATISVSQDTANIANGVTGTNLTPKFSAISASSSGDNTVVAAVTSKKIRVLAWDTKVNAAVNFKWKSATAGDKTGLYYNSSQGDGVARAFNPVGYFETAAGEALVLNLSGAVAVGGCLTYVEV